MEGKALQKRKQMCRVNQEKYRNQHKKHREEVKA